MKTAIYITDGIMQLVLTPESGWEKSALASFKDQKFSTSIMQGSFYDCRGGWTRHSESEESLILRAERTEITT